MGFTIICRHCGRTVGSVEHADPPAGRAGWYAINAAGTGAIYLGPDLDARRGQEISAPIISCSEQHHTYLTQVAPQRGGQTVTVQMRIDRPMLLAGDDLAGQRSEGVRATSDDRGSAKRPATATDPTPDPYRWPQVDWPSGQSRSLMLTLGTKIGPVTTDGVVRAKPPKPNTSTTPRQ
jgi:hypothetical protein